jgi:hypothetical protein
LIEVLQAPVDAITDEEGESWLPAVFGVMSGGGGGADGVVK